MEPLAIRLLVNVDAHDAVITGEVISADGDGGADTVSRFSGHLGLITAIERAISAAVEERSPNDAQPRPTRLGNPILGRRPAEGAIALHDGGGTG